MRLIRVSQLTETIAQMAVNACCVLPDDVQSALHSALETEDSTLGRHVLEVLINNFEIAQAENIPTCQDTGMVWISMAVGREVQFDANPTEAIQAGVRQGYLDGYLRKSVVGDPLRRQNTGDNTPAIIHWTITEGDKVEITLAAKGFGSENMSQLKMLTPSDGLHGVREYVLKVVSEAGPNACPPLCVGIGIGGTFDSVALLAKRAAIRPLNHTHPDPFYANLESEWLEEINHLGIGPQGYGGKTTALSVAIETQATHIGALPVAVNLNCHATRHITEVI